MSLKVAIVGTGNVARASYLPYLAKQEDVSLSYYSRTRAKADACAADFGGGVVGTMAELVAANPDTVLVLTNEKDRYAAATELLALRPRRVFFEKPLVALDGQEHVTEQDFERGCDLLRRAKAAGTETAMVFNYRFYDQTQRAVRIVAERELGRVIQVTAFVHYACWSHCIDLIQLFGGPVATMTALEGERMHAWGVSLASDAAAAFRLANGATGTILGTCGPDFTSPLYELILSFERGRISMRDLDGPMEVLDYRLGYAEHHTLVANRSRWDQYHASFGKSLRAYLDSVAAGAPPPVPGIAGVHELQFEAALRRSAAESRPVDVQAELPIDL